MKTLHPYLTFSGNCEEAMHFYKEALGAEIVEFRRFDEMDPSLPAEQQKLVMHANLVIEGINFMLSDAMPDQLDKLSTGSNFTLTIDLDSEDEQSKLFEALSQGGQITMPLMDTAWNARFGMLIDKYGFSWSFNCDKK